MASKTFNNTLYYGDNLEVLRKYFRDECVDLIYLDPPFNSKADYNILFKEVSGEESAAQIQAFSDFWHWDKNAEKTYIEIQEDPNLRDMIQFLHAYLGRNDMMAYLVMMTIRLKELHRVLKSTGSLYLHCDYHASAHLRLILDRIFGEENFRNEIIWKRKTGRGETQHKSNQFGVCVDYILFYAKSKTAKFNTQFVPVDEANQIYVNYVKSNFKFVDANGRKYRSADLSSPSPRPNLTYEYKGYKPPENGWAVSKEKMEQWEQEGRLLFPKNMDGRIRRKLFLDELKGKPVQNLWDDIQMISSQSNERLGYPTQKPVALLKRIIKTGTDEGEIVLDPFCGCGTTIMASQELKRRWIGIDITHLAISLIRSRLKEVNVIAGKHYEIIGEPADLASAGELASSNPYQFQWWALSLIDARPTGQSSMNPSIGKKGADKGVDGWITFRESANLNLAKIVVQVKGGHVGAKDVRDLIGTVDSTKSAMGILITLEEPTQPMKEASMEAEYYESYTWGHKYPKIQMLTVEQLLSGEKPILPHTQSKL
jgi:site-specific DNA-methyltransferase (adenine-specific)